jgi:hypothetical protein
MRKCIYFATNRILYSNLCEYFEANMKRMMRIIGVCEYTEHANMRRKRSIFASKRIKKLRIPRTLLPADGVDSKWIAAWELLLEQLMRPDLPSFHHSTNHGQYSHFIQLQLRARAQESIPTLAESIPGLLERLQIWALASSWPLCVYTIQGIK